MKNRINIAELLKDCPSGMEIKIIKKRKSEECEMFKPIEQ